MKKTHKEKVSMENTIHEDLLAFAIREQEDRLKHMATSTLSEMYMKLQEILDEMYRNLDYESRLKYDELRLERTGWIRNDDKSVSNITLDFNRDISKLSFELEAL